MRAPNTDLLPCCNEGRFDGLVNWLSYAATPVFAAMALYSIAFHGPEMICLASPEGTLPSGMISMYILMSIFHATPWLRLVSGQLSRAVTWKPNRGQAWLVAAIRHRSGSRL